MGYNPTHSPAFSSKATRKIPEFSLNIIGGTPGCGTYLANVRIEKARNLLLNRNLRISEIAYEVGFQSLPHFNRVFKQIVGENPTQYRDRLPAA